MSLIGALVLFTFILLPPPLPLRSSDNTDDLMPLELEPHVFGFPLVVTNLKRTKRKISDYFFSKASISVKLKQPKKRLLTVVPTPPPSEDFGMTPSGISKLPKLEDIFAGPVRHLKSIIQRSQPYILKTGCPFAVFFIFESRLKKQ